MGSLGQGLSHRGERCSEVRGQWEHVDKGVGRGYAELLSEGLNGRKQMVPQTPPTSDRLCQVTGGPTGLARSLAHSRCSGSVC